MHARLRPLTAIALAAAAAAAQAQTAYAERSEPVVLGDEIHLYSLPTKSADGTSTKYWDVTVTLSMNSDGRPNGASVAAQPSPKVKKSQFVVGTYQSSVGNTCTVSASPFNGRTEYSLSCYNDFITTWYSGTIAGHRWEAELVNAGLDQLVGASEYGWGKVMYNTSGYWFGCFNSPELVSARQVGDVLTLVDYGNNDIVDCQMSFTRTGP